METPSSPSPCGQFWRGPLRGRVGAFLSGPGLPHAPDSSGYFPARGCWSPQFSFPPPLHLRSHWPERRIGFLFLRGACGLGAPAWLRGQQRAAHPSRRSPCSSRGLAFPAVREGVAVLALVALAGRVGTCPRVGACRAPQEIRPLFAENDSQLARGDGVGASWGTLTVQEMQGLGGGGPCRVSFLSQAISGLLNWITPAADATSP